MKESSLLDAMCYCTHLPGSSKEPSFLRGSRGHRIISSLTRQVGPRALALAVVLGFGFTSYLNAQTSACQNLTIDQGDPLRYRDRGGRCEGVYKQNVGAKALTLLSLNFGDITYPLQSGTKLAVTVPTQHSDLAYVRALPKPSSIPYEMDSVLKPGQILVWPVEDILLPEQILSTQIGVFARETRNGQDVFLPVRVKVLETTLPDIPDVSITIRPSFDVQKFKWRWAPINGANCGVAGDWQDAISSTVSAGQSVRVKLPRASGVRCLTIAAQGSDSDWKTQDLQIDLP